MPLSAPKKINPLSAHALSVLDALACSPMPRQEVNPGVVRRLTGEHLAEIVDLPSPYKKHRGSKIAHLQITAAGRKAKAEKGRREAMPEPMWCVKHRDGWCAAKPNRKFADSATSIATQCGYFIALPWGCEQRFPTCEECQKVTNTGPLALEPS